jgi:hypothetical protein
MQTVEREARGNASDEEPAGTDDTRVDAGWPAALRWGLIGVAVAFFLIRILGANWPHFMQPFPETTDWRTVARLGPLLPKFWFTSRPPFYALLMWLVGRSTSLIVIVQTLLYVGAVLWLCRTARGALRGRAAYVVVTVLVVAIAIEARTALWTTLVLPESISITLAIALIAVWWRVAAEPSVRRLTWAWVLTAAFVLQRDANVLPAMFVIVPVAAIAFGWRATDPDLRRRALSGAGVVLLLCAYVVLSQHIGHRHSFAIDKVSDRVHHELPGALRDDSVNFDASSVSHRLPHHIPVLLGEARTTGVLWFEIALAAIAVAITATEHRRRRVALFGAAGLAACVVGLLATMSTITGEIARNLAPDRAALSIMIAVCLALGIDTLWRRTGRAPMAAPRPITSDRVAGWITVVLISGLGMIAAFGNWFKASAPDSQYAREIVVRAAKYGGTYYDNAVLNRGPLEEWLHTIASHISSYDGYWYTISIFVAIIAVVVAFAVARTARATGAVRELALAAGIVAFMHFALGPSTYAGVFFIRNITTCLLVVCWTLLISERTWATARARLISTIAIGALLGLTVQSLLTAVFVAAVLGVMTLVVITIYTADGDERRKLHLWATVSAVVAFIITPVYYLLRGDFTQYWSGFWTYASFMSRGTNESTGQQFAVGWDQLFAYYRARPVAFAVVVAFLFVTWLRWANADRQSRVFHAALVAWFVAAWIELILSQRYQPQYFVVTSIPVALMAAALAGHAYAAIIATRGKFGRPAWYPVIAVALSVFLFGSAGVVRGAQEVSSFTSVRAHDVVLNSQMSGDDRSFGAVLDLASKKNDPLLAWTLETWPYLTYHRVAATRFIWKSFLAGEIWMGGTSPKYILPHTWQWFDQDVKQSHPAVFTVVEASLVPGSPFTNYVNQYFTPVYDGPNPIYYRNDAAAALLQPSQGANWVPPAAPGTNSGWKVGADQVVFNGAANTGDLLPLFNTGCYKLSGTLSEPGAVFQFTSPDGSTLRRLALNDENATAGDLSVQFSQNPSGAIANTPTKFVLIVGARSAGLIVGNRIRAAVPLPAHATTSLGSLESHLTLTNLRAEPAPAAAC